jgi:tellurite resistance protein
MSTWDTFDERVGSVLVAQDVAEWSLAAMACVAYADGVAHEAEIARAEELVRHSSAIAGALGPDQGIQFFHQVLMALELNPERELEFQKVRLGVMASRITDQEQRDAAFFTLIAMATADRDVTASEHALLVELKALIGSKVMVPMPQVQC